MHIQHTVSIPNRMERVSSSLRRPLPEPFPASCYDSHSHVGLVPPTGTPPPFPHPMPSSTPRAAPDDRHRGPKPYTSPGYAAPHILGPSRTLKHRADPPAPAQDPPSYARAPHPGNFSTDSAAKVRRKRRPPLSSLRTGKLHSVYMCTPSRSCCRGTGDSRDGMVMDRLVRQVPADPFHSSMHASGGQTSFSAAALEQSKIHLRIHSIQ